MTSVTISTFANVATDLLIIALPLFIVSKHSIQSDSRKTLLVYAFVIVMGSLSIIAAVVRYGALKAVWGQPKASVTHTIDVWAMVEILTSLLAACLPSLRVWVRGDKVKRRECVEERYVFRANSPGKKSPAESDLYTLATTASGGTEEMAEVKLEQGAEGRV